MNNLPEKKFFCFPLERFPFPFPPDFLFLDFTAVLFFVGGSFEGEEYKPDTTVDCRTVSPAVLVPRISVSKDVLGTGISVIFDGFQR